MIHWSYCVDNQRKKCLSMTCVFRDLLHKQNLFLDLFVKKVVQNKKFMSQ